MASIVVSGNTSGTITISAPDVSGSNTLTLPASTGTVLITNGSGIASVNGVQFPATQSASADANTLDDYEEGTWTPTATGFSTNTGWSGTYTKIGRLVYLTVRHTTAITSTKLTSIITGLPFLPAANSSLTTTSDTNVNNLGVNLVDDGGTNGRIFPQSWTSSGTPYISATYITNT